MKKTTIHINTTATTEKSPLLLEGLAFVRFLNEKIRLETSNLKKVEAELIKESTPDKLAKKAVIESKITDLETQLQELPEVYRKEHDVLFADETEGNHVQDMVNVFANFFGNTFFRWNLEPLYQAVKKMESGEGSKKEIKSKLDNLLCILKKKTPYLQGIKVTCNMGEVELFYRFILKGFRSDRNGTIKVGFMSYRDFKRTFALYIISLYNRADIKVVTSKDSMTNAEKAYEALKSHEPEKVETETFSLPGQCPIDQDNASKGEQREAVLPKEEVPSVEDGKVVEK